MKSVLFLSALGAVLVACGGGGGGVTFRDPDSVQFTFGDPAAPATGEQTAADVGAAGASSALDVQGTSDGATAQAQSQGVANIPNDMSDVFGGTVAGTAPVALRTAEARVAGRAAAYLAGDTVAAATGWDDEGCWTVTATAISFDHCTQTVVDGTATGTLTVNGTFHREAGHVWWDATVSVHESGPVDGGTVDLGASNHLRGDITTSVADQTIVGYARSDISISASAPGQSVSLAVTYNADLDLVYQTGPFCVTGGTLTLKRIWAQKPSVDGIDPSELTDRAVQFTWLGCANVNVAWSVP